MDYDDREKIREIYERNVDTIFRICFSYLKNVQDSEDAVSSVFMKLMKCGIEFSSAEDEKKWLIVVACNYCKSQLRSGKKHRRIELEKLPEQEYWDENNNTELLETILSMPEKYKNVLYLHFYEDYSLTEIAEMTGERDSTIRSRLFYGKKKLLKLMGGGENEKIYRFNGAYISNGETEK